MTRVSCVMLSDLPFAAITTRSLFLTRTTDTLTHTHTLARSLTHSLSLFLAFSFGGFLVNDIYVKNVQSIVEKEGK